ncbi:hypothetical protein LXL04_031100 [Taraxacum kok-saghyz]
MACKLLGFCSGGGGAVAVARRVDDSVHTTASDGPVRLGVHSTLEKVFTKGLMAMMGVKLHFRKHHVVMENGIVQLTLTNPGGYVTGVKYNNIDNLLEVHNDESDRGYWDLVWSPPRSLVTTGTFERIEGTSCEVVVETGDQVELSFSRTWDPSLKGKHVPLKIDKRFVLLRGCSGFYSYGIYQHLEGWPAFNLPETRIVFKLRKDKFHYMAMSDDRHRYMPLPDDRSSDRGKPLAYPEAVLLVDPLEPEFKGETTGPPPAPTGPPPAPTTGPPSVHHLHPPPDHRQTTGCAPTTGPPSVHHLHPPPDHRWTTAGPPSVHHLHPPPDHRMCTHHRTTVGAPPAPTTGPPPDHRWTTAGPPSVHHLHPPPDHRRTTVGPPAVHPPPDHRRCTTCTHHRTTAGPPSDHRLCTHHRTTAGPLSEIRMTLIYDADAKADEEMLTLMSVDDKYQYSCETNDLKVHGWISTDPSIGFWQITPSNEFRTGGPTKQELTSHVGPINLAVRMFVSAHYGGNDLVIKFDEGEPWKKVFGPVFTYLNSTSTIENPLILWEDAKNQMLVEVGKWPYNFPASKDFQRADERGLISGRLLVYDRFITNGPKPTNGAYIGIAPPGNPGSWQFENKSYQFWSKTNEEGYFSIQNVLVGTYNLYAWVHGFIGDYINDTIITITPGCGIDVGDLLFEPPRDGPTLWEIGVPDRSAAEFYIPDPDIIYMNQFLVNPLNRFRQYGLWERYSVLYPDHDLVFTIGESDYEKDWFFAHVTRKTEENTYEKTTWTIKFKLNYVNTNGIYKLRLALASANMSDLQIRINDPNKELPLFSTGIIGGDNAIARHGIHGLYWLFNIDILGMNLRSNEENAIYLTQANAGKQFYGVMYDYIRLEGPAPTKLVKRVCN